MVVVVVSTQTVSGDGGQAGEGGGGERSARPSAPARVGG